MTFLCDGVDNALLGLRIHSFSTSEPLWYLAAIFLSQSLLLRYLIGSDLAMIPLMYVVSWPVLVLG